MTTPLEPKTNDEIIAASALLATGCAVRLLGNEVVLHREGRPVFALLRESGQQWTWRELYAGGERSGIGEWAEICERLRRLAVSIVTEQPPVDVLPTGYDPVTLSHVLRAAVGFGEAKCAGDQEKSATALEVIRGHKALVQTDLATWGDV